MKLFDEAFKKHDFGDGYGKVVAVKNVINVIEALENVCSRVETVVDGNVVRDSTKVRIRKQSAKDPSKNVSVIDRNYVEGSRKTIEGASVIECRCYEDKDVDKTDKMMKEYAKAHGIDDRTLDRADFETLVGSASLTIRKTEKEDVVELSSENGIRELRFPCSVFKIKGMFNDLGVALFRKELTSEFNDKEKAEIEKDFDEMLQGLVNKLKVGDENVDSIVDCIKFEKEKGEDKVVRLYVDQSQIDKLSPHAGLEEVSNQIALLSGMEFGFKGRIFPFGNRKLPSYTMVVNMNSSHRCPSQKWCPLAQPSVKRVKLTGERKKDKDGKLVYGSPLCYAMAVASTYKDVDHRDNRLETVFSVGNMRFWEKLIMRWIDKAIRLGHYIKNIRLNEAGDFATQEQVEFWERMAGRLADKGITVTAYTRNKQLNFSNVKNMILNYSSPYVSKNSVNGRNYIAVKASVFDALPDTGTAKNPDYKALPSPNDEENRIKASSLFEGLSKDEEDRKEDDDLDQEEDQIVEDDDQDAEKDDSSEEKDEVVPMKKNVFSPEELRDMNKNDDAQSTERLYDIMSDKVSQDRESMIGVRDAIPFLSSLLPYGREADDAGKKLYYFKCKCDCTTCQLCYERTDPHPKDDQFGRLNVLVKVH